MRVVDEPTAVEARFETDGVVRPRRLIWTQTWLDVSNVGRQWTDEAARRVLTMVAGREIMVWRFSLQNPHINQQRGFATLEARLISLQAELESRLRPGRMSDFRVGTLLGRLSAIMFMQC